MTPTQYRNNVSKIFVRAVNYLLSFTMLCSIGCQGARDQPNAKPAHRLNNTDVLLLPKGDKIARQPIRLLSPTPLPSADQIMWYFTEFTRIRGAAAEVPAMLVGSPLDETPTVIEPIKSKYLNLSINKEMGGGATLQIAGYYSRKIALKPNSSCSFYIAAHFKDTSGADKFVTLSPGLVAENDGKRVAVHKLTKQPD